MPSPDNMDELIATVARRANVSHQSATQAVDTVLTAVKDKLPDSMANSLVRVMAGEDEFKPADARAAKPRAAATRPSAAGANGSSSGAGTASGMSGSTGAAKDKVEEKFSDVSEKVGETVADVSETVKEVGGKAFEEVGRVGSKAFDELGTTANRVSRWAKDFIDKQKK